MSFGGPIFDSPYAGRYSWFCLGRRGGRWLFFRGLPKRFGVVTTEVIRI